MLLYVNWSGLTPLTLPQLDLAHKLERVAARCSLPAGLAVADVEAEPDRPGETVLLQGVVLQVLAPLRPPELRHLLVPLPRPLPEPGALSPDVVPGRPVLASPPPRQTADELDKSLVLAWVLQPQQPSPAGLALLLRLDPAGSFVREIQTDRTNPLKLQRTLLGSH